MRKEEGRREEGRERKKDIGSIPKQISMANLTPNDVSKYVGSNVLAS